MDGDGSTGDSGSVGPSGPTEPGSSESESESETTSNDSAPGGSAAGSAAKGSTGATETESQAEAQARHRRNVAVTTSFAALAIAPLLLIGLVAFLASRSGGDFRYTIPAGTGARIAQGEKVEIIPSSLDLKVGDRMIVKNEDDQVHLVGPFSVRPGETVNYQFARAGVYKGECSVHSSGEVVITVT